MLRKTAGPLGLSIVGGSDHASHPFGVSEPGVFVSKVCIKFHHYYNPGQKFLAISYVSVQVLFTTIMEAAIGGIL